MHYRFKTFEAKSLPSFKIVVSIYSANENTHLEEHNYFYYYYDNYFL